MLLTPTLRRSQLDLEVQGTDLYPNLTGVNGYSLPIPIEECAHEIESIDSLYHKNLMLEPRVPLTLCLRFFPSRAEVRMRINIVPASGDSDTRSI